VWLRGFLHQRLPNGDFFRRNFQKVMKKLYLALFLSVFVFGFNVPAQKNRLIGDIQSDKNFSSYVGETARVFGIVTARVRNGFFIQTPDEKVDGNPNTSEGIFVFTSSEPSGEATIGNLVSVTGTIDEFKPRGDQQSLPITQIRMRRGTDFIAVESKGNALPKPIVLTVEDFKPNKIDQLEKYEGMRVTVSELTVIAPTRGRDGESDGTFYGVIKGFSRPFREPGFSIYDFLVMPQKEQDKLRKDFPKLPLFDHNPERLRIESAAQLGAQPIDVTSFTEIKNLTGVMNYSFRTYSILVDSNNKPEVSGLVKATPLPAAKENQLSIAGLNVENLFDEEDDPAKNDDILRTVDVERKLKKISMAIRMVMQTPDIVSIIEVEHLTMLKRLADRINADSEASGKPNPKYEAYLIEGNDGRSIDVGFLVKSTRVKVLETKQYGKDEKYQNPVNKNEIFLNDRPPLLIKASINNVEFAVIVNHLKSFNGYNDEKDAPNVRLKKKLQAEFLAKLVAERLKADPNEKIALTGDFNAYQFNDGITDVIDTIKGTPSPKDAVFNSSDDLLNPDLIALVDLIKADQRYSYIFDANAQAIDNFIVNENFRKIIAGFGYARVNADYPEIYRKDDTRLERFSDHDAAVAYFTIDNKSAK
jgi:hypothetical protein